ncbi:MULTISPECIES: GTPase Era [Snodgrassella]|uniref:GTPase Era n=1 Tax=Snodgrassella TaxID=1193515 RepID=UPI000A0719A1|nr:MULTISPECIES: GTPase Era [Snodgrassella]MBI0129394.1 GTPase Era [Snodgrassella sp. W8124]MBI0158218.1 GTPase Era [Snodgrassella sp. W6238H11]MBI0159958.1 GTPase Era [Snodgrassella sp. W6238H14]ORF27254.1 GTPase Era [Snodgrassella alvi]
MSEVSSYNYPPQSENFRCGFVAIVGRPNVGKSTLMNHLIGQKISITSKKAQTTRHKVNGIYTDNEAQLIFVDTPGFQTYHRNALNDRLNQNVTEAVAGVDVIVFVIEALRFSDADREVLQQLPAHIPVVLVINKVDKAKAKDQSVLQNFIDEVQQAYKFTQVALVSAKHGLGVAQLVHILKPMLPIGIPLYPEDMVTDKSARFLAMEIVREKLFRYLGEELPYAMNVEVEQFTEEDELYRIYIAVLVDKESQKGILIGKGGEKLKKISTEARLDMEKLFETKVFLKVWVKVKSGWADDIRFLRELGM